LNLEETNLNITDYVVSGPWKNWLNNLGVSSEDSKNVTPLFVEAKVSAVAEEQVFDKISDSLVTANFGSSTEEIVEEIVKAKVSPVVNGRPRMLQVSAIIAHEGENRNRDAFFADELKEIVASQNLFKGAYAGLLDINHNFTPYGYWYDSEFLYDDIADAFAILAHGAVWAWRFPDMADKLIATQARNGKVGVSMACLSPNQEMKPGKDGRMVRWLHSPTFIASTLLIDDEPGDLYGRGLLQEDPRSTGEEDRKIQILQTASSDNEENLMDIKEIREALTELLGSSEESVLAKVAELLDARDEAHSSDVAAKDELLTTANATVASLNARIAELEGDADEKSVALNSLKDEKEVLLATIAELEQSLQTYRDAEEKARVESLKVARLEELSEPARHALEQMPDEKKESLLSRWASLSDAEWLERKEELNLTSAKKEATFGRLPVGQVNTPAGSIDRFLNKK
jgi:hypothetical protein